MWTTIRVNPQNRDQLARIAEEELGGVSLDEALRVLLFQHQTVVALGRLANNSEEMADYRSEAQRGYDRPNQIDQHQPLGNPPQRTLSHEDIHKIKFVLRQMIAVS